MPLYQTPTSYGWQAPDRGLLAQNCPYELTGGGNTAVATAGRLEFAKVRLPMAASVTNVVMNVQTVGVTLTAGQNFAALFSPAGALIGQTADQAAAWVSTGTKAMALAGGPYTCAAGNYFVGFWYNGTTAPAMLRMASIGSAALSFGTASPNLLFGTADTGLTTTAPANMAAQTASTTPFWVALS